MKRSWTIWPKTRFGKLSLFLILITFTFALALSIFVAIRRSANEASAVAFNFGIPLNVISILSLFIGWVSFSLFHERSRVVFISLCVLTVLVIIVVIHEITQVSVIP